MSAFDRNLADFFIGHDDDPLLPPPEFVTWRAEAPRMHALMERTMGGPAGAHTRLETIDGPRDVINMASLDYLGICGDSAAIEAQRSALVDWGSGACGVPLLSGMTTLHRQLERRTSELTGKTGSILFTSGYAGAMGVCSALLRRGDVAILDAHAHMSWVDGVRMSGATLVTFAHDDPQDLDRKLQQHATARRLVIVDGLYSMDGDLADLPALLDVCDEHGVGLIVDEAHSVFALGAGGGGAAEALGVRDRVRLSFGTYSKALSVVGGFVSGDAALIDYIRYYAHPYVFSAALPPATVAGIIAAMDAATPARREKLADNATWFRERLAALGFDTGASTSHIVPVIVGSDRELLYRGTHELMERGLFVAPVDYPAVAEDRVRLRCAVSAAHSAADLQTATELIAEVFDKARRF